MATTAEPPEHRACRAQADLERDERLRAEGRRQANDAITWDTTCIGCAGRLNDLYAERCAGNQEAAKWIEVALRAAYAESGDRALLEAVAIARAYAGRPAERYGEPR